MDFNEQLNNYSNRTQQLKGQLTTEESTKTSLIMPFFQMLGYDIFNPLEFCPEYTADVGIKKGEKVDYAILKDGNPVILIECKSCNETLDKHSSQLFRYFGTTSAKFCILTNGIVFQFFTDLEEVNKMDLTPFLEINFENLKDYQINELKKFRKTDFDSDRITSTASNLKYTSLIKDFLQQQIDDPNDDFVKYVTGNVYDGPKTQKILEQFSPLVKKSFASLINELVNKKISSALDKNEDSEPVEEEIIPKSKIVTTEAEIESYYIIRGMLAGTCNVEDVTYRDTESYFGILFTNNNRKPICRLNLDRKNKQLFIPDENKKYERIYIDSLNDLYKYKSRLIEVVKRYI
ncbi:type I restriction endonuclease [Anaerostipes faecalis]|uniref:type I restriction endonuclease n=1 Tax=Anaerostipes faecalis TaxID=2738446 RepID=UPI003F067232